MKNSISEKIRKFFNLDDAYIRNSDDYIRLAEIIKNRGTGLRWMCNWCDYGVHRWFCGKKKAWLTPYAACNSDEWVELFCVATLARRLQLESKTRT
jgi:hypothetical protein